MLNLDPPMPKSEAAVSFNRAERRILRLVRQHHRVGRAQLSRLTGLSRAAVGQVVNPLVQKGVLRPVGPQTAPARGRPQKMLGVAGERVQAIGIAIDHHVEIVLMDLGHRILDFHRFLNPFNDADPGDDAPIERVMREVERTIRRAAPRGKIIGIGVSVGGDIDQRGAWLLRANDFSSIGQANRFIASLRRHFGVPVVLEHEARAALLAERWAHPDFPPAPSLLYIKENLGFAIMLEGRLYQGPPRWSRWLGHVQVDPHAPAAAGLAPGALGLTGWPLALVYKLRGYAQPPSNASLEEGQRVLRALYQAYRRGDPQIVALIHQSFDHLGMAIRNLAVVFAFDLVVLHGWPRRILAEGIQRIEAMLRQSYYGAVDHPVGPPPVRRASWGRRQQALGTAQRVFDVVLEEPDDSSAMDTTEPDLAAVGELSASASESEVFSSGDEA